LDAAMERERLVELEKEKAKEEAKKRYVCSKIQNHCFCVLKKNLMVKNQFLKFSDPQYIAISCV